MGILYAISIVSFCALLWAVVSVARHIRRSHPTDDPLIPAARNPRAGDLPFLQPERTLLNNVSRRRDQPLTQQRNLEDLPAPAARRPRHLNAARADYKYFNKDLGDLKDPAAPRRARNAPGTKPA